MVSIISLSAPYETASVIVARAEAVSLSSKFRQLRILPPLHDRIS
jgi:hypothetical protein